MMPTNHECVCCCEIDTVYNESENDISCITDHEGLARELVEFD